MKRSKRIKRHVASVLVHQAARTMDQGCSMLFSLLEEDAGSRGFARLVPIRHTLTEKERKLLRQRKDKVQEMVKDIHRIGWHLEMTSRDPE